MVGVGGFVLGGAEDLAPLGEGDVGRGRYAAGENTWPRLDNGVPAGGSVVGRAGDDRAR